MGIFNKEKKGKLTKEWEFKGSSPLLSEPVVGDLGGKKVIVFGTKDGKIYTLEDSSKVKWLYDIQEKRSEVELLFLDEESLKSVRCPPILADIDNDGKPEVIFGSDNGLLHVLSESGKLKWEYDIKKPIRSSALAADINGDKKLEVIFGGDDCKLYALSHDGKLLWSFKADSALESVPCLIPGKVPQVIFGSDDGQIYSLNPDGKELWRFKTDGKIAAQPVVGDLEADGNYVILVGSLDNSLYAINSSGKLVWRYMTEGSIYSRVCLADINGDKKLEILFGSCDNSVYALDSRGHKIWSYETDFWVMASPFVADIDNDGKLEVVAGSYDHSLYVLDAEGSFMLNYMPGISGITQQPGHYSGVMSSEPGQYQGKKIWEYKTDSFIVGSAVLDKKDGKRIVIGTKKGDLNVFKHEK